MRAKKAIAVHILFLSAHLVTACPVFAETVVLKSGLTVEGRIIRKTDATITMEQEMGSRRLTATYFLDGIESINGEDPRDYELGFSPVQPRDVEDAMEAYYAQWEPFTGRVMNAIQNEDFDGLAQDFYMLKGRDERLIRKKIAAELNELIRGRLGSLKDSSRVPRLGAEQITIISIPGRSSAETRGMPAMHVLYYKADFGSFGNGYIGVGVCVEGPGARLSIGEIRVVLPYNQESTEIAGEFVRFREEFEKK